MKKMVNGIVTEMTMEEEAAYLAEMREQSQTPPDPTPEQRIEQLEEELKATKILLGLEA